MIARFGKLLFCGRPINASRLMPRAFSSALMESEIPEEVLEARQPDMPVEMEDPFSKPKPKCILCEYDVKVDYKNVRLLSQFVSPFSGKVYGRHISGLCERQQRIIEEAINISQRSGLMPYYCKVAKYIRDPCLFNPDKPLRSHRF